MTVDVNSLERKTFQASGADSVGNSLEVTLRKDMWHDDVMIFKLEIHNPWSGDSESGFGRWARIDIPIETMLELAKFVIAIVKL